ncbi:hypothetical protein CC78DRAFT_571419 [Lojkania enalia]|uniref:Rhodopsin domain-containing protein n=1 Tax=Lojkania enalia TaxID=147567 RepID=A0A9P4N037_9PLEO|nr:hypothetical protein CC78DRAFT_571419 [Didymosphaeria enalia]
MPTAQFEDLLVEMLAHPPNPNEPLPLANRKETIFGSAITFLIISWLAVALRLYTRLWIVRDPGLDDLFVTLSAICNTVATSFVLISVKYGLGRHFLYLPVPSMTKYFLFFYVENATYVTQTALIKISLLFQYLRIFKGGFMKWMSIAEIAIIGIWGFTFGFMAWFPCFPVKGFWNRITTHPTCYGFGFHDAESFVVTFEVHTAMNMVFDLAVFLTPMVLFKRKELKRKNFLALTGVFTIGAIVVFTSIWRMISIVETRAATDPYIDFTWWSAKAVILSCLEINLAIICASMPIFWPVFEKSLAHIFVTREVHIMEHQRLDDRGAEYELERFNSYTGSKLERGESIKSSSGASETLKRERTTDDPDPFAHYKDRFVIELVDPLAGGNTKSPGVETKIKGPPRSKWKI